MADIIVPLSLIKIINRGGFGVGCGSCMKNIGKLRMGGLIPLCGIKGRFTILAYRSICVNQEKNSAIMLYSLAFFIPLLCHIRILSNSYTMSQSNSLFFN